MRKIPAKTWLLAILSSGLLILVFPPISLYFLSWVAIVPLLYALLRGRGGEGELVDSEGRSLRPFTLMQGFMIGWVSSLVWYIGTCYWLYIAMHGYGGLSGPVAALLTVLFCMIMALDHGVFGLLVVLMARRSTLGNRGPLLMAPFFWAATEFFHARVMGFAWNPLGGVQVDNIPFARIANVTGVYGLSFAVVLVNSAFVAALLLYKRRRIKLLISAVAAAVALQAGVFAKPDQFPADKKAILVQGNIPLDVTWTEAYYQQTLDALSQLSTAAASGTVRGGPGLIIWPESPAPFEAGEPRLERTLAGIAQSTDSYLVVGATAAAPAGPGQARYFNSALVLDPSGRSLGRYDKIHLVPFGEYVPLRDLLFFARNLTNQVGDFSRGTERKVFDLNGARAGVNICYETVFPEDVREFVANGAQVLINISDDAWYGESGASPQQWQMARMRAIENHRWVLVATNSGITGSIDPGGRIVARAERNVRLALTVPFSPLTEITIYTRYGDFFAWTCVVISLIAVLVRWRIRAATMIEAPSA
ncbi:MAG TPA: apolipoprotein N-acyltransferase [Terriglobales bacterium]